MEIDENIEAVERMQAVIEAHLKERITLHMLAEAAGYSPWHAARMFKDLTGRSPFDYIRTLRLSRAAVRLREEEVKVVDVAFDFLFDSHEGFTRAFTRQFGITPWNYSSTSRRFVCSFRKTSMKNISPLKEENTCQLKSSNPTQFMSRSSSGQPAISF